MEIRLLVIVNTGAREETNGDVVVVVAAVVVVVVVVIVGGVGRVEEREREQFRWFREKER